MDAKVGQELLNVMTTVCKRLVKLERKVQKLEQRLYEVENQASNATSLAECALERSSES